MDVATADRPAQHGGVALDDPRSGGTAPPSAAGTAAGTGDGPDVPGGRAAPASRWRRVLQFALGLSLCATGVWLSIQAGLGLSPWDVLHAGVSRHTGLSFGQVVMAVGAVVLALSAALRVRPGLGTAVNIVVMGVALDALAATPWLDGLADGSLVVRTLVLLAAVVLLGAGAALYIGAGFGAGPRDGLMVACHHRGLPLGWARCLIEVSVLVAGYGLGGPVGMGTLVVAFATGPAVQAAFRVLGQQPPAPRPRTPHGGRPHRRGGRRGSAGLGSRRRLDRPRSRRRAGRRSAARVRA